MKWRTILFIAQKDIVEAIKNMYMLFSLLLPILMSLLFRVVFPSPETFDKLTIAVYDPGHSRVVSDLRGMSPIIVLDVSSAEDLANIVESKAVGGLLLPADFDASVAAKQQPDLKVYLNRKHSSTEITAFEHVIESEVWSLSGKPPVNIVYTGIAVPAQDQTQSQINALANFNMNNYLLVMFLTMSISMTGSFVVPFLMVEEKEKHTLEALLASPAGPIDVTAGKAITGMVYSLLGAAVLVLLNKGLSGNWPMTLLVVVLGALLTVSIGLLLGSVFHNSHQVNIWSSIIMLALLLPTWLTILGLPAPLDTIMRLIPTYYMADALNVSLAGRATLSGVWLDLLILAGCILAVFSGEVWVLRRERK